MEFRNSKCGVVLANNYQNGSNSIDRVIHPVRQAVSAAYKPAVAVLL
jgi:hypothetical protein